MKKSFFRLATVCLLTTGFSAASLFAGGMIEVPSDGARTISLAMIKAKAGDTVLVADGTYYENIIISTGTVLKAKNELRAKINGRGRGIAVTMGKNATISGFVITQGTIGVFSNGRGNSIIGCRIERNWLTGVVAVRQLPKLEDNMITYNRSSGIQLWDCRSLTSSINHNTIAFNSNHGIAVGGVSELTIENNIIAFNERLGIKILGGSEKVRVRNNSIYSNLPSAFPIPGMNFSDDPLFSAPWKMDFSLRGGSRCIARGLDAQNLGARIVF